VQVVQVLQVVQVVQATYPTEGGDIVLRAKRLGILNDSNNLYDSKKMTDKT
jgi:hypothetical protein